MSTHYLNILNAHTQPDSSGNVTPAPNSEWQSNDRYPGTSYKFADSSTRDKLGVSFRIPQNYVSNPSIVCRWATTTNSGKIVQEFDYTSIAVGESGDPSADQESVTSTGTTVPGTARLLFETTSSLTAANLAAGDTVQGQIVRDGADTTNDTLAAAAYLVGAWFKYDDA